VVIVSVFNAKGFSVAEFADQTFGEEDVILDGNTYKACTFNKSALVYNGGSFPVLEKNRFDQCQWRFDGAAARTIQFMRGLYHGGGKELIEQTFKEIMAEGKAEVKES